MKIKDLQKNTKIINVEGKIVFLGEVNHNETFNVDSVEGILEDESDQIKIVLWNEEIKEFNKNDNIIIKTGWCKEFEGELQVSSGKHGKIIKV